MSITTKNGDTGYTALLTGEKVHKSDIRIELLGSMDELTSNLGLAKSEISDADIKNEIEQIQKNLSLLMAQTASKNADKYKLSQDEITNIESLTYKYEGMYIFENKFILPGKNRTSALLDVGRTICRRVERNFTSAYLTFSIDENALKYLNRLSDYLYALARYIDFKAEIVNKVKENLIKDEDGFHKNNNVSINLNTAKKLLERVEHKAEEMGLPVVISAANEWGNIIAVHFMDGALPGSYSIAVDKAYTSAVIRLSTEKLGKLSQNGQSLYGINNTNNNRIVVFGGGVPLKINGTVVGGLGVSGGTAEQDTELANFGEKIFKEAISLISL